jgi:hypothetical protein
VEVVFFFSSVEEFSIIEKGETGGGESGSVEAAALECGKSEKLSTRCC